MRLGNCFSGVIRGAHVLQSPCGGCFHFVFTADFLISDQTCINQLTNITVASCDSPEEDCRKSAVKTTKRDNKIKTQWVCEKFFQKRYNLDSISENV